MVHRISGMVTALVVLCWLAIVPNASRAEDAAAPNGNPAIEMIKQTVDEVVKIDQSLPGEANTSERRAKLRALIEPRFDFEEMAKRSLGAQWLERTPEEQTEFVRVFSDLLAHTYMARIEDVKPGMVKIESENLDFPRSVVKTQVTSNGDTFPIDYKLLNMNGHWRVYDVVIENIGLVANYRNEFAGIVRKEGFPGLMSRLREKAGKF
jgi:phospholipid transport system substrate-binding protein